MQLTGDLYHVQCVDVRLPEQLIIVGIAFLEVCCDWYKRVTGHYKP